MKIGLYFGSFNPIHTGHCIIASHLANNTSLQQVWLVISPQNPFKPSASLLNEYHRLHLAKVAVAEDPLIKVSDIEFHLPRPSYTIDTLTYLQEKYPENDFSVIMGSDSFQNLPRWKNASRILENFSIYIYNRPGYPMEKQDQKNLIIIPQVPLLEISSTYIRSLIKEKKSIRFLVPDSVRDEIEQNGYYK